MNRIQEIETRMNAIKTEIEQDGADLDALEVEVRSLKEERAKILANAEKRKSMLDDIATGVIPSKIIVGNDEESRKMKKTDENKFETMEYRKAFMDHVIKGTEIPTEFRTAGPTKTTDIGAVIPTTVLNKIVEKIEATGMILPLVTRTTIKGGVSVPTSTVKPEATWVSEGATSTKQKKTTGQITFSYHKLRCAVSVTLETDIMAMSAFEAALISNIVEAMVKALEQAIISGDGSGKPKGILKETPNEGQALKSDELTYQLLVDAEAALPMEYEAGAVWCMTKKTFMGFVGMVDVNKQPIARVNYGIGGKPERYLLGRPVVLCNYLDTFSATLGTGKPYAFLFDFKDYMLNTNYTMGLKKYEDNETDDFVTKAIMIADGKVLVKDSLVTIEKNS